MTSNFPRASRDPLEAICMFLKPLLMDSAVKPGSQTPGTGVNKVLSSFFFWNSCFTMLCWFLLCNEASQFHVYRYPLRASLVAQKGKRLPVVRETWAQSLGREDPLKWYPLKRVAKHESAG